jgi:hypothetical protein
MNSGDLVRVKDHPEHIGLVLNVYDEDGYTWIKIQWFGDEDNCFAHPLHALNHLEVIA